MQRKFRFIHFYYENKMRKFYLLCCALCMISTFGACDIEELKRRISGEEEEMVEEPYFKESTNYIIIKTDAPASGTFTVETNRAWKVTEKPEWCELEVMEGVGQKTVNVSIQTSTPNQRIGYIKVFCAELQKERTIEVKQNGNTLSIKTGDCKRTVVTPGSFLGTDKRLYKYEHKVTVEFTINGAHLASECGVTGSTFKGINSDGTYEAVITYLTSTASHTVNYRAFATDKATGKKIQGVEKSVISR